MCIFLAVTIQTHTIPEEAPLFDRNFLTIMVHSYLEMSFVLSDILDLQQARVVYSLMDNTVEAEMFFS